MALNFPNSPGIGSVFTDTTSGFSWQWDGTVWKSYSQASSSNIKIIDNFQKFNSMFGHVFFLYIILTFMTNTIITSTITPI